MSEVEEIQILTLAAQKVREKHPFRTTELRHRFDRWGPTTSALLLEQLNALGWTICKKENHEDVSDVRPRET